MALELFKPFVMRRLASAENTKGASAIDRGTQLLGTFYGHQTASFFNRAPTLHRLSIQVFEPVLIEVAAKSTCTHWSAPFNADFDGDQMSGPSRAAFYQGTDRGSHSDVLQQ